MRARACGNLAPDISKTRNKLGDVFGIVDIVIVYGIVDRIVVAVKVCREVVYTGGSTAPYFICTHEHAFYVLK